MQFKQAYRRAGVEFAADELPDHLCAVLQFGACVDVRRSLAAAARPPRRPGDAAHGAGRRAAHRGPTWWWRCAPRCRVLQGEEEDAVRRLIEEGPPAEEVGLEPYLIDPQIPVGPPAGGQ